MERLQKIHGVGSVVNYLTFNGNRIIFNYFEYHNSSGNRLGRFSTIRSIRESIDGFKILLSCSSELRPYQASNKVIVESGRFIEDFIQVNYKILKKELINVLTGGIPAI